MARARDGFIPTRGPPPARARPRPLSRPPAGPAGGPVPASARRIPGGPVEIAELASECVRGDPWRNSLVAGGGSPAGFAAMTDESADDQVYASPGSLEGLLRRGRNLGASQALDGPETSAEPVYEVVRRDWRWDTIVDDRHLYLARLIRDLGLVLDPVFALLAGDGDDCERATGNLELLALSGSVEAREGLRVTSARASTGPMCWSRWRVAGPSSDGTTWPMSHGIVRAGGGLGCGAPSPGCAGGWGPGRTRLFARPGRTRSTWVQAAVSSWKSSLMTGQPPTRRTKLYVSWPGVRRNRP